MSVMRGSNEGQENEERADVRDIQRTPEPEARIGGTPGSCWRCIGCRRAASGFFWEAGEQPATQERQKQRDLLKKRGQEPPPGVWPKNFLDSCTYNA